MEGPQGVASHPGASWDFRQVVAAQRSRETFKNAEEQLKAQREFSSFPLPLAPYCNYRWKSQEAPGYQAAQGVLFSKVTYKS